MSEPASTSVPVPETAAPRGARGFVDRVAAVLSAAPVLTAGLVAFAVFCAFSGPMLVHQSQAPHFVWQADGWLHGTLGIVGEPPNGNDWARFHDRWFMSFPPFPAVLMLPFVALHGIRFNDVFFTVCIAAFNVGLFVHVLRVMRTRGLHVRSDVECVLLAWAWAFGSVYFYSAIRGEVWFTAHVVGVGLTLLYVLASLEARHPWLAGIAFGLATATRANLVYAFPFFVLEAIRAGGTLPALGEWPRRLWAARGRIVAFGVAGAVVLAAAFLNNYERFGSPTEFGHSLLFNNRVTPIVKQWGLFHPHFLPGNLKSAFLMLPTVQWHPFRIGFDGNGMSMFLTTPLLLLLLAWRPLGAIRGRRLAGLVRMLKLDTPMRRSPIDAAIWITILAVGLPGLFYMNNGWYQFGYRFSNDYLPYLFMLLALGGRPLDRTFAVLAAVGVVVSGWGAVVFGR